MLQTDLTTWRIAPTMTWDEDFATWLWRTRTRQGRERGSLTIKAYLQDARLFSRYFEQVNGRSFSPDQLNAIDLENYFRDLQLQAAPASYNRKLASLRMLVACARENGCLEYDPSQHIPRLDAHRDSPRNRLPEERSRLEQVAGNAGHLRRQTEKHHLLGRRDAALFCLLDAGLRIHEAVGLNLDDLHLDEGFIHVLGKGKKHRKVYVSEVLKSALETWLKMRPGPVADEAPVLTGWLGDRITTGQARRRFYLISGMAEVDARPHDMRHTYIYRLLDQMRSDGSDMPVAFDAASQQTGDRVEVIMEYYTRARQSQIQAAVGRMQG